MRPLIPLLAAAASMAIAVDAAPAVSSSQPPADAVEPPIKVVAPALERLVCRPVTRTATRINLSAVCRTREAWAANGGSMAVRSYRDLEHLADRLATITHPCGTCWKD
jgi:hypothetical protein